MIIAFRADAGQSMGSGHVRRSQTLAAVLRRAGHDVHFLSRGLMPSLAAAIRADDINLHELSGSPDPDRQADDLGMAPLADAREVCEVLTQVGASIDWVVVDSYALDQEWEKAVRSGTDARLMAIDDLASRGHDVDLLLDQNLFKDAGHRYDGLVDDPARLLLGPRYALLGSEFVAPPASEHDGSGIRALVFFGSADSGNLTGRTASILAAHDAVDHVDVVLGSGHPHGDAVRSTFRALSKVAVHESLPSLAPLMSLATVAVGGGGSTNWERLVMGLPTLVIPLADNQRLVTEQLAERSLVHVLQDASATDDELAVGVAELLAQDLDEVGRRCRRIVDGHGARRVAAVMEVLAGVALQARQARADDEWLLLEWANEEGVRRAALDPAPIAAQAHAAWFASQLQAGQLRVIETATGHPVGQVRLEPTATGTLVHYSIDVALRGLGLGQIVLDLALKSGGAGPFVAKVRVDNPASRNVFGKLGFEERERSDEVITYVR